MSADILGDPEPLTIESRVEVLELPVRAANCLRNENIVYIKDLVQKSVPELLRIPNFGRKSLKEVTEALAQVGMAGLFQGAPKPSRPSQPARLEMTEDEVRVLGMKIEEAGLAGWHREHIFTAIAPMINTMLNKRFRANASRTPHNPRGAAPAVTPRGNPGKKL